MPELNIPESVAPLEPIASPMALDHTALAAFLSHTHKRKYRARTDVFRPGEPAKSLFYVISGSLAILAEESDGRELLLAYVHPGDFIGATGVFYKTRTRSVILRTRSACELAEIGYEQLHQLCESSLASECPKLLFAIGSQVSRRLMETTRKASRLAHLDVANRILRALHDLTREPDALQHADGWQIKVSRQELSRITGCSREMAGRVLKQLQEQGLIHARGKTVVVYAKRQ